MSIFDNDDLRIQLAERMGIEKPEEIDAFKPLSNVAHDYMVLHWMRAVVQHEFKDTYRTFISYLSGSMHQYNVGDYARGAMCALGIDIAEKD